LLIEAARAAAAGQHHPEAALYVVATPIGNLADITLRAVYVLSLVDAIACEDTRHSTQLLRHLGLEKPLLAVHEHNEREASAQVLERLASGQRVAYISDAGTPAISDPGAALVQATQRAGYRVIPLPGPSSAAALMSVAGDTLSRGFDFLGFLPTRGQDRDQALATLVRAPRAQVLFEAPHRIEALARALAQALGSQAPQRSLTIGRELTKQFETVVTLAVSELPDWLAQDKHRVRGEFALVLHAPTPPEAGAAGTNGGEHDATLGPLLQALPLKQAVALTAEITGAPRNAIYERALALKKATSGDADEAPGEAHGTQSS
jgi:16S rRNA (cytidine1402-2'-O)-methyltransferase